MRNFCKIASVIDARSLFCSPIVKIIIPETIADSMQNTATPPIVEGVLLYIAQEIKLEIISVSRLLITTILMKLE